MLARLEHICVEEVLRYLGCYRAPELSLLAQIKEAEQALLAWAEPRLVWKRLPMSQVTAKLLAGQDLKALLQGCSEIVLFAASLGTKLDLELQRLQRRDLSKAVILDACANSGIESVCDNFCGDLRQLVAPKFLTERYSPGYGDLPLEQQRVCFDLLDVTRRIGVTLTQSNQMLPQKSVTAILGISESPRECCAWSCVNCRMFRNCSYRKENTHCERI